MNYQSKNLLRNSSIIFYMSFFLMFLVLMPVYVPYMTQLGLTMEQIYTVQSLFAFGVLIFEIPSGYISDLWGRRESLILGCLFHAIGLTLFAFSENIYVFYCAELILAFGSSLISGTDISLIYESNEAIGQKSSSIKDIGKIMFYRNTGEAIAALLGGWLFTFYFKGPVIALAITGWFPFFLSFLLVEPPKKVKLSKEHKQNFKLVYQALFKHSKLLNLILLNGIFYSVSTLLAVWSFQVYWKEIGISKDYFGYLWFIMNLVVALFARWAPLVEKRLGSTKVLLLVGLLPIICFGFMGFIKGLVGVVFAFIFQVVRALNGVVIKNGVNKRARPEVRATVNSVMGMGMHLMFLMSGPAIGYLIDHFDVFYANKILSISYIIIFLIAMIPLIRLRHEFDTKDLDNN